MSENKVFVKSLHFEGNALEMQLRSDSFIEMATLIAAYLDDNKIVNFSISEFIAPDGSRYTVTAKRNTGKTVEERWMEVNRDLRAITAERDSLRARVAKLEEQKAALLEACEEYFDGDIDPCEVCRTHRKDYSELCDTCEVENIKRAVAKARGE